MKIKFIVLLCFIFNNFSTAQDSSFILKTNIFENYTLSSLSNGYFSIESSLLCSKKTSSYMAWIYDHGEGDVARIARLPAWNEINYFDGKNWLNDEKTNHINFSGYKQNLNMHDGVLSTRYDWIDQEKTTSVEIETFISRKNKNLAAIKFVIKPKFNGRVKLYLSLKAWPPPNRKRYAELEKIAPNPPDSYPAEWYPGNMKILEKGFDTLSNKKVLWMKSKADGRNVSVDEVINVDWTPVLKHKSIRIINNAEECAFEISFNAEANQEYIFYKYISAVSSNENNDDLAAAKRISKTAREDGYEEIFIENKNAWDNLWQTDIIVDGDPEFQKVIHSMMFYLFCSVRSGTNFSIPPMGLANDGYYGHIFWDADTFMFPALLLMHPGMAKSMVNFRFKTLDAAKQNAKMNGYNGAMYPWESDELGNEATPRFAYQNALRENHITGDVALAQWQYYLATQDKKWLSDTGYYVIKETADFWLSRSSYNKEKNRYEIKNIVSVDEGRVGINNDTYTNSIAKKNLQTAIEASRILNKDINPKWKEVENKIFIPYDSLNQIYPTYENSPDSILGSVVTMLNYPLLVKMNEETKKNNLTNAAKLVYKDGPGAMMTITLLPVIGVELKNEKLFNELVNLSYKPFLHQPYNVLTETPNNHSINFITGAGGFLQQVIYGYTGLRITDQGVIQEYKPMLPFNIKELTLKNFYFNEKKFDVNVKGNNLKLIEKK
jgi:trehalose/maltose hydrolase-like predicted phosphorylase